MKLVGFRESYDKHFFDLAKAESKNDDEFVVIDEIEIEKVNNYLLKSEYIQSKTLALFEGDSYIAPYIIYSDGEWVWPSYFYYFLIKEKKINYLFLKYLKEKDFKNPKMEQARKSEITCFVEEVFMIGCKIRKPTLPLHPKKQ